MTDLRRQAIALFDAFTHEHGDRRRFMRDLAAIAGSVAAAEMLAAAIAPSPAAAAAVDPADARLVTRKGEYAVDGGRRMTGYFAVPRAPARKLGAVMVIHENRGLNAHVEDVARRLALAGFFAVAPDFLSFQGGTPADADQARALIGQIDYPGVVAAGVATLGRLRRLRQGTGRVGAIGFCWGGAMVHRVAVAAGEALDAGVSYYGPAPDPAEAAKVQAATMIHLAGNDARVNATGVPWAEALRAAGKPVESFVYPGVEHAFNNDTAAERYNAAAAATAWERTLAFLHARLDNPA